MAAGCTGVAFGVMLKEVAGPVPQAFTPATLIVPLADPAVTVIEVVVEAVLLQPVVVGTVHT
jgi:hypothetical protein